MEGTQQESTGTRDATSMHPSHKIIYRNQGAALFQKYIFSWSYEAFLKSRNYPVMRVVTERRSDHVACELFSNSQTDEMDVGSEAEKQCATTHRPDLQTDLATSMKTLTGPQDTSTTTGVKVTVGPAEKARYYQCNLPVCASPLKDACCMKYPASTPNPTPTPTHHADASATKMPSKRTMMNQPCTFYLLRREHSGQRTMINFRGPPCHLWMDPKR